MKLLYRGKTKDVYEENSDTLRLFFSDRVTQNTEGRLDPGGNEVAGKTALEQGKACLLMTSALFSILNSQEGIHTHMLAIDTAGPSMLVRRVKMFSPGLEWIGRWVCTGSFLRRYQMVPSAHEGARLLMPVFEITLKDDSAGDPLITPTALIALGVIEKEIMDRLLIENEKAMHALWSIFADRKLDLWDIKIEWGLDENNNPILIDEISPGSCRVFDAQSGERLLGMALAERFQ